MDRTLTLIFAKSEAISDGLTKIQHFYILERNEFSPNLKDVAQKLALPSPFDVLDVFGGKSKSAVPRAFKFVTKRAPIKVNNW